MPGRNPVSQESGLAGIRSRRNPVMWIDGCGAGWPGLARSLAALDMPDAFDPPICGHECSPGCLDPPACFGIPACVF